MTGAAPAGSSSGLRERKKSRTRTAIQSHAFRLFRERGYDATTMDQIAEAAEVSASTLFRYFPTKRYLVLGGGYFEPLILDAIQKQPPTQDPLGAIRSIFRSFFQAVTAEERSNMHQALALIVSVPSLRAAMLDEFAGGVNVLAEAIIQQKPRSDEFTVRVLAGAVVGAMTVVMFMLADDPTADLANLFDRAIGVLEARTGSTA